MAGERTFIHDLADMEILAAFKMQRGAVVIAFKDQVGMTHAYAFQYQGKSDDFYLPYDSHQMHSFSSLNQMLESIEKQYGGWQPFDWHQAKLYQENRMFPIGKVPYVWICPGENRSSISVGQIEPNSFLIDGAEHLIRIFRGNNALEFFYDQSTSYDKSKPAGWFTKY